MINSATPRPLACRLSGAPSAPPLVLLHCVGTDSGMWTPQMAAFRAERRVIAVDLPGHGDSAETLAEPGMESFADEVAATLAGLGVERFDLVGLSLGGMVAAAFALKYGERLNRLVICDARLDAPPDYVALWDRLIARVEQEGMDMVAEAMIERWFGAKAEAPSDAVAAIRLTLRRMSTEGFVRAARALQGLDMLGRAGEIAAPSLLLVGERDGVLPQAMAEMAAAMPQAELRALPDAGHLSNIDQPRAFGQAVLDFLR